MSINLKRENVFLIILSIITAIYYIPVINLPLAHYDESFILAGADRILKGQIPHKDFSSEYPAGQFYTLAALFKVFGTSVMTERIYDIIIRSFLALTVFLIIRLFSSSLYALAGWAMSLIWVLHSSSPAYSVFPSMLFIFISIYLLIHYLKEQKNYYIFFSAISIFCAILFRHDLGGYAAVVITVVLLFRRIAGVQSWTPLITFLVSAIMAALPVIIFFAIYSDLKAAFNDLVLIPMAYREYQALPYPSLSRWNLPFYIFPFVLLIGALSAIILIKRNKDDWRAYSMLLISFIGIFCFNQVTMRSDIIHLFPVAQTGILLAPILLYTFLNKLSLSKWKNIVVSVLFVIVFSVSLSKPLIIINMLLSRTNGYIVKEISPDIERAKYSVISMDINKVVSYIKKNTSENEYIYVGVKNHDQFVTNYIVIYFLANRNYASRYHSLSPGVQTTLKVQNEMVSEFKKRPPRLIILSTRIRIEPNLSGIDTKVDVLDNYIAKNFELKESYGLFEIWMNKL